MIRGFVLAACLAGVVCGPARAQNWAQEATSKDGLSVPVAVFVKEEAHGYGMYTARPDNHFKPDESLRFYMEPVGYAYEKQGDDYRFGATVDLRLLADGKEVFSKDGFLQAAFTSHHMNKEIDFTGVLDVAGAPKGDYKLELKLTDKFGKGSAVVVLPFVID